MGWFSGLRDRFGGREAKAVDIHPDLLAMITGILGHGTKSGQSVSLDSSLRVTAFYRGVLTIAEDVAQLPIEIYRKSSTGRGVEPATDHPLYDLLKNRPNEWQDGVGFWCTMLMHAVATGDAVAARVEVNGELRELLPIRPENCRIDLDTLMRPYYDLTFENGGYSHVSKSQVFHIQGPSWRSFRGLDPIEIGKEAIGLSQATEEAHARLHQNGTRPSGILTTDKDAKFTQPELDALRELWMQTYGGSSNTGKTPILTNGLTWKQVAMSGVDAEHLDTRKHQIEEIARLLGVFPIMLGHAGDQSPTFASAEAFFAAHVRKSLMPWVKRTKAAIETQLLTEDERRAGYHVRIDTSELTRGSLKDRNEGYKAGLGTNSNPGWLTPNDVRADDGYDPIDDPRMDQVWMPATMAPVNEVGKQPAIDATGGPDVSGMKSSAPRTLYISRKLLNANDLVRWAKGQGFKVTVPAAEMHVTIAYSKTPVDWMAVGQSWSGDENGHIAIPAGGPRVVEPLGKEGAVVLKFSSDNLAWRNQMIRECGASWDYPEYQPHVTITYDASGVDLSLVQPFTGELRFGPEIFAEIVGPAG